MPPPRIYYFALFYAIYWSLHRIWDTPKFAVYDFHCSAADIIHPPNPLHLIVRFELFRYALTLRRLLYKSIKHFFSLLVDISKVSV